MSIPSSMTASIPRQPSANWAVRICDTRLEQPAPSTLPSKPSVAFACQWSDNSLRLYLFHVLEQIHHAEIKVKPP